MVVYYHRFPPFVLDERHKPVFPVQPDPRLTANLSKLGEMVDFIVMTSNSPHALMDLIEETTCRKVMSMIEVTVDEVRKRGWQRVGIPSSGVPRVYTMPLEKESIVCETLTPGDGSLMDRLDRAIYAAMEGPAGPEESKVAMEAVQSIQARGGDGIILGCTEIPLLLGEAALAPNFINPAQLLA